MSNEAGTLYVVATPIGNLEDITRRALAVLEGVDLILAEDTRRTRQLLSRYGLHAPLTAYHEHNEARMTPRMVERLRAGQRAALVSDAGTPVLRDPGCRLVRALREADIPVVPVPGPSALTCALSAAGVPADRFVFEGFAAPRKAARMRRLEALADDERTLVFFESPRRAAALLEDMASVFGAQRAAVVARELTKIHEAFRRDTLGALAHWARAHPDEQRGEFVVIVEGADAPAPDRAALSDERLMALLLEEMPPRQAVRLAARITGSSRNALYRLALQLSEG